MKNKHSVAVLYALAAALFYALNVPYSKILLNDIPPTMMAAFLYLGAGLGVGLLYLPHIKKERPEERLAKKDLPYTVGMIVLDIVAPVLLMCGVKISASASASLLGNFEIVATTLIALLLFREKVSRWLWIAIALITTSSVVLTFSGADSFDFTAGSLLVLGATICWGLENNCTRRISDKSTYQIVILKGFFSGAGALLIALAVGETLPESASILYALLLGFIAYGLSIFTYVRAQNTLGAAKTSAYYAVAPFIGVFLSFVLLQEPFTANYLVALLIMIVGTGFVVYDTLSHTHCHAHSHVVKHTENGITYTGSYRHTHPHAHVMSETLHRHSHRLNNRGMTEEQS